MKLDFEYGQGMMSAELPDTTDVFIPGVTVPDPPCIEQTWDAPVSYTHLVRAGRTRLLQRTMRCRQRPCCSVRCLRAARSCSVMCVDIGALRLCVLGMAMCLRRQRMAFFI